MYALKFSHKKKSLDLRRVPKPEITEPDDILIRTSFAGVCIADLKILKREYTSRIDPDLTPGHEFVGVIVDVGRDVISFQEGDRVGVFPSRGCKRCAFCASGRPYFCKEGLETYTIGFYKDGGWAQYVLCPEEQVFRIPASIPLEQAVLSEPVCCMVHGLRLLSPLSPGMKILITGSGITGCLWAAILHLEGHKNVTISEPNLVRREFARRLNTGYTLTTPEKLKENAENDPDNYLFDVIIECSGNPAAIEHALTLLNFGGRFCQFGVTPYTAKIKLNLLNFVWKEQSWFGVRADPNPFIKALGLIEALGDRYLNYSALGLKMYRLEQYKDALEALEKGTILKPIFRL